MKPEGVKKRSVLLTQHLFLLLGRGSSQHGGCQWLLALHVHCRLRGLKRSNKGSEIILRLTASSKMFPPKTQLLSSLQNTSASEKSRSSALGSPTLPASLELQTLECHCKYLTKTAPNEMLRKPGVDGDLSFNENLAKRRET